MRVKTETVVDINASLHIGALIQSQIPFLIVPTIAPVSEWRNPGALRLQCFCPFLSQSADKACTTAFNSEIWIENGVCRLT